MAWIGIVDWQTRQLVPTASWGHVDGYLDGVVISIDDGTPEGRGPAGRAVREGRYQVCHDFATDPRQAPWASAGMARGYRSSAGFPFSSGAVTGVLTFYSSEPHFFDDPRIRLLEGLAADVAIGLEREQAERRISAYQADLRRLVSELTVAEERERRRLATELHDSVLQLLAFAKMRLLALAGEAETPDLAGAASEAADLVQEAMTLGRSLLADLVTPELYDLGFEAAIEAVAKRLSARHDLPIDVSDDGSQKPLSDEARVTLHHGVRELLVNVAKHAHATGARVALGCDGERVRVEVVDDGVGLDPAAVDEGERHGGGFGLFSLRERIKHLDGTMTLASAPGQGARFVLTVPVAKAE